MSPRPGEVWLADLGLAAKTRPVVAGGDLEDSVAEDFVAAAGSGGVDEDNAWNFRIFFLEKLKPQTNH
jgi:hypothetical protein